MRSVSSHPPAPRGAGLADVLIVLAIVVLGTLLLFMAAPGQRSDAREAACRSNLARIGAATILHDQLQGRLPRLDPPGSEASEATMSGPLARLLTAIGQNDFDALPSRSDVPDPRQASAPGAARVIPGFLCPEDPEIRRTLATAPVSYRACTGRGTDATDGAFRVGTPRSLLQIESADGTSYTALFSERLLGLGTANEDLRAYEIGPLGEPSTASWPRGSDAGFRWDRGTWRDSLYNHAQPPGQDPDRIEPDGRQARMSARSGHRGRVQLLRADGSVGSVTTRIDPGVWWALAEVGDANRLPGKKPAPRLD
jgi:hypothetical protein